MGIEYTLEEGQHYTDRRWAEFAADAPPLAMGTMCRDCLSRFWMATDAWVRTAGSASKAGSFKLAFPVGLVKVGSIRLSNMPSPTPPPEPRDTTPIATTEEFKVALLRVRDRNTISATDLVILRAFCAAPGHTLTGPKLAQAAGLSGWQEANLRFGALARHIGEALNFTPSRRSSDGELRWWMSAAHGAGSDEEDTGYFQWVLRPELVDALKSMKWA